MKQGIGGNAESANNVKQIIGDDASGTQYLTCLLAGEQYGPEHIAGTGDSRLGTGHPHPQFAALYQGVINLRGTIVAHSGFTPALRSAGRALQQGTVVIVVRAADKKAMSALLGLVVDAVSDVIVARDEQVVYARSSARTCPRRTSSVWSVKATRW